MAAAISKAIINYKHILNSSVADNNPLEMVSPKKINTPKKQSAFNVSFSVQIAASKKAISTRSYNFKGLKGVVRKKEGKIYRYYYSSVSNYETAKKLQTKALKKGFKGAFLVAFKNGKKVDIKSVLP